MGMMEVYKDLQKKSVRLNPSQYGPVEYLLSCAACGNRVTFYYNDLAGQVRSFQNTCSRHLRASSVVYACTCSGETGVAQVHGLGAQCTFDTATPKHRAWLLLFVANIYRVLLSLSTELPFLRGVFPDSHWQERADGAAVMRMIGKDGARS